MLPESQAVAWLLLETKTTTAAAFANVTHIQRVDTWGGLKPATRRRRERTVSVPYRDVDLLGRQAGDAVIEDTRRKASRPTASGARDQRKIRKLCAEQLGDLRQTRGSCRAG